MDLMEEVCDVELVRRREAEGGLGGVISADELQPGSTNTQQSAIF